MVRLSKQPHAVQWLVALVLAALCLVILGGSITMLLRDVRGLPLVLLLPFLLPPLESLLLTPLYALVGRFRYYSPLLFATTGEDGVLELHVGTLFDYLVHLPWQNRGVAASRLVTEEILRGLLAVAAAVEREDIRPEATIRGSSYFFSPRSLQRFGFELEPVTSVAALNLRLASLSLALRLSFVRGRWTFPDLRGIRAAVTSGQQLVNHQAEIRYVLDRLERAKPSLGPGVG